MGASQIVRQVVKAVIGVTMIEEFVRITIKIVDAKEEGDYIKKLLGSIKKGLKDAQGDVKTWNKQVTAAVKAHKLQEKIEIPALGISMTLANVFSAAINSSVAKFVSAVLPSMVVLAGLAK